MPNDLYLRTCAELSHLISSRAAERLVSSALRRRGYSSEDVSEAQMRRLLLGPVLRELQAVLPGPGLERNLRRVVRKLDLLPSDRVPVAAGLVAPETPGEDSSVEVTPLPTNLPLPVDVVGTPADEPLPEQAGELEVTAGRNDTPVAAPQYRSHDEEELRRILSAFAQIDHVRLVAAIRAGDSPPVVLGGGVDVSALARYGRLALGLLGRGGPIRSLHVGHTNGELFFFPLGQDLLVLVGNTDLNLGAVATAFRALRRQEEL